MTKRFNITDIKDAYERIKPYVYKTQLEQSIYLGGETKNVFLKLEYLQPVKAFKIRGALNKILSLTAEEKEAGVMTVSSGNHGISVSYGAKLAGIEKAVVIVPENTPGSKLDKIRHFGGQVELMGADYNEADKLAKEYMQQHTMTYIDGWDKDRFVYGGQGTIGLEIMEQNPDIDTILIPVGGGALCTSIAMAAKSIKPNVKVIGLQTEACPAMVHSVRDGKLYHDYESDPSICEAVIGGIGHIAYEMRDYVDAFFEVKEEYVRRAVSFAIRKEKIVVEPSGAIPIAAMLQYGDQIKGENIALVISGGNIDESLMVEILNQY